MIPSILHLNQKYRMWNGQNQACELNPKLDFQNGFTEQQATRWSRVTGMLKCLNPLGQRASFKFFSSSVYTFKIHILWSPYHQWQRWPKGFQSILQWLGQSATLYIWSVKNGWTVELRKGSDSFVNSALLTDFHGSIIVGTNSQISEII